ncbi:winged helix-turn-helix domain-containing protein [Shewanella sp. KX20019]|uniref:winged helix-turn-helix domain-containing protein n=1 Tax=Shewanella sp. KX20019 TaxID=2803864 RepID=UPI001928525D|nr:winged helix-turn-helix domain-containing protein [Shewanella sp. KX20019]QQX78878.1 winged helix-turn-helix domain-containing protein [Shewanella sp. KX20019]
MAKFSPSFRLGNIEVDPNTDQLKCDEQLIEIQSMAMKVLCYLCRHSERLISRDNLRDEVWANTATSNHTINNHIYSLRRNLAKLDPDVKYIHTVTGGGLSGYRLSETLTYYDETTAPTSLGTSANLDVETLSNDNVVRKPKQTRPASIILLSTLLCVVLATIIGLYQFYKPVLYQDVQLLTELPGREQAPSVATDGSFIAFSNKSSGDTSWELFAITLASPLNIVKLFDSEGNNDNVVSISPSGKKIAFHRLKGGEEGIYIAAFDSLNLQASQERRLIPLKQNNLSPAISWLDENRFFYSINEASWAPEKIFLFDTVTGNQEQISSPALRSSGDFANMVSPNKQWLAILRSNSHGGSELILYRIATQEFINTSVQLTDRRLNVSFSDDSESVYFIDDMGYLSQYDIEYDESTRISEDQFVGYWPLKIPGENQFILQQDWGLSSLTTEIVSFNNPEMGGDGSKNLVVNNGLSIRAIEGVNDNGFIFVSVKPNHQIELWRYKDNKAYKLDQFAEKETYRYPLSLNWQRGSNQALLSVGGSCRSVNIDSGKDTPLCPKGEFLYAGTYSADGQAIYFAAFDKKQSKAVKMGSSGYPIESLPLLTSANMVQDGGNGYLYYRVHPDTDIFQLDISAGTTKKLINRTYITNGYTTNDFVVVDDGIYFMDKPKGQSNAIYYYDFNSDVVRYLFDTPNLYPNIVLSEDQQFIYLIQSAHNDTGLLLVE